MSAVFQTIYDIHIEVFGDFTSVMKDAKALALYTGKRVNFQWNTTSFTIKGEESLEDLWEQHYINLELKRK